MWEGEGSLRKCTVNSGQFRVQERENYRPSQETLWASRGIRDAAEGKESLVPEKNNAGRRKKELNARDKSESWSCLRLNLNSHP
jgi:hypothetical protein